VKKKSTKETLLIFIISLNKNKTDVIAVGGANLLSAIKLLSLLTSGVTSHYLNKALKGKA